MRTWHGKKAIGRGKHQRACCLQSLQLTNHDLVGRAVR